MRRRVIAFFITLVLGVYAASFLKSSKVPAPRVPCDGAKEESYVNHTQPFTYNLLKADTSRNYTKAEASALIGKRVRNLTPSSAKCMKDEGSNSCLNLYVGETGKIVDMLPGLDDTYLLEIQWDKGYDYGPDRYPARLISRADKGFSFALIK